MGKELAVGIAATLIFFFSVLIIPIMGVFAGIFTPLPTLLFFYRWGSPLGYLIPGGAALVGCLLLPALSMVQSIPYFLGMITLGLLLGAGMRQGWSAEKTIGSSCLVVLLIGALVLWLTEGKSNGGIFAYLEEDLRNAITVTFQQYGAASLEKPVLEEMLQKFVPVMVRLLPGAALSSVLVASWLNVLVSGRFCRLRRLPLPPWGEWSRWKAPEHLVWVVIACGAVLLLPVDSWVKILGLNVLIVLGTVYLFQGLAVISFYFERWKLPKILRAILYAIFLLQQFVTFGVILMGLFDMWFDFRRLTRKSAEEQSPPNKA